MQDAKILVRKGLGKRWIWVALVLAILTLAYIDGGEEPLRPIDKPIALPGDAR